MTNLPSSAVIYSGPSMIDGSPIVAVATGLGRTSKNAKTGNMVQVWILRSDVDPITASRTGQDHGICGDCIHRGTARNGDSGVAAGRSCYVLLHTAPLSIYRAFRNGSYPAVTVEAAAEMIRGRPLRLGAYGDPAAVPLRVWQAICPAAAFVNAYTHQWRHFPELAAWCMASADSEDERAIARVLGFRVFRVRAKAQPVLPGERVCPASEEAGRVADCVACKACGGQSARTPAGRARPDMVIMAHGRTAAIHVERRNAA